MLATLTARYGEIGEHDQRMIQSVTVTAEELDRVGESGIEFLIAWDETGCCLQLSRPQETSPMIVSPHAGAN